MTAYDNWITLPWLHLTLRTLFAAPYALSSSAAQTFKREPQSGRYCPFLFWNLKRAIITLAAMRYRARSPNTLQQKSNHFAFAVITNSKMVQKRQGESNCDRCRYLYGVDDQQDLEEATAAYGLA